MLSFKSLIDAEALLTALFLGCMSVLCSCVSYVTYTNFVYLYVVLCHEQ
jgi:hypothetical protein